jgi:hypothetical protein
VIDSILLRNSTLIAPTNGTAIGGACELSPYGAYLAYDVGSIRAEDSKITAQAAAAAFVALDSIELINTDVTVEGGEGALAFNNGANVTINGGVLNSTSGFAASKCMNNVSVTVDGAPGWILGDGFSGSCFDYPLTPPPTPSYNLTYTTGY